MGNIAQNPQGFCEDWVIMHIVLSTELYDYTENVQRLVPLIIIISPKPFSLIKHLEQLLPADRGVNEGLETSNFSEVTWLMSKVGTWTQSLPIWGS